MLTDKLNTFTKQAINTFLRFPFAMLMAIFGAIVAMALVDAPDAREVMLIQILLTTLFGLPLAVSVSLIAGFNKWKLISKIVAHFIVLALMILFYLHLPNFDLFVPGKYIMQFVFFIVCAWLTVFFLPLIIQRKKDNIFWNYIYLFFAHLGLTIVFTGILYGGLSFVILSVDKLLIEIPRDWHIYQRLWIFITGIIAVWFFLSKMPKSIKDLDTKKDYPKYLQALSNFILVPVITVYGLILYIYGVRSLITWSVPNGEVIYLFTTFFVFGTIINFIVSPDWHKERKWLTDKFLKYYFITVIPLLILYFVAIGIRLSDYGITESRYFVVLFGVWLLVISLYLLIRKKQFIIIPVSIFVLMLIASFGPWGANAFSERNQIKSLNNLLTEKNLFINGKLEAVTNKQTSDAVPYSVKSVLDYLIGMHGVESVQSWFITDLQSLIAKCKYKYCLLQEVHKLLPLSYSSKAMPIIYHSKGRPISYVNYIERYNSDILNIKGYDYIIYVNDWEYGRNKKSYNLWGESFSFFYHDNLTDSSYGRFKIYKGSTVLFNVDIGSIVKKLDKNKSINKNSYEANEIKLTDKELVFTYTHKSYELKIFFNSLKPHMVDGEPKSISFGAIIALKKVN